MCARVCVRECVREGVCARVCGVGAGRRRRSRLGGVPAVDEEKLRRAVLCVLRRLLLADFGEVPHVEAAVRGARREDRLVEWRPRDRVDLRMSRRLVSVWWVFFISASVDMHQGAWASTSRGHLLKKASERERE